MEKRQINAIWLDDEPQAAKEFCVAFSQTYKKNYSFDYVFATSISEGLRKLKQGSFDYIFVDNYMPLGSTSYLEKEGLSGLAEVEERGLELIKEVFLRGRLALIRTETLKGVVFCSAVPLNKQNQSLTRKLRVPFLILPKEKVILEQKDALAELEPFFRDSANHTFQNSYSENEDAVRPRKSEEPTPAIEGNRKKIAATDMQLGPYFDELRWHIHEANRRLIALSATLDGTVDKLHRLEPLEQSHRGSSFTELIASQLPTIDEKLEDAFGNTSEYSDVKLLDEVDSEFKSVKRALEEPNQTSKEFIINKLIAASRIALSAYPTLGTYLKTVVDSVIISEAVNYLDTAKRESTAIFDSNTAFLELVGGREIESNEVSVNLVETIDTIIRRFEAKAEQRKAFIRRYMPETPISAFLKVADFETVLSNLIDNALKNGFVMPERKAWVDVQLSIDNSGAVRVSVENWGAKISDDEAIYKPKVRGRHSLAPGSGEGLRICKSICDRNGWKIGHSSTAARRDQRLTRVQNRSAFINTFWVQLDKP